MKSPQPKISYRHYNIPSDSYTFALLGSTWTRNYSNVAVGDLHFHNCLEIGYCHNGAGIMTFGEKEASYESGMFTVIPPNCLHATDSLPGRKCSWEFLFVDAGGFLAEFTTNNPVVRKKLSRNIHGEALLLKKEAYPLASSLILQIISEIREKADMYKESVRGLLQSLLIQISRMSGEALAETGTPERVGALAPAIEYISERYMEKIIISELAEKCHLSETHFRKLFLQSMQISPLTYVNRIRVDAANKLLLTTNMPVCDIALKCGFITITTFNRNFKRITGESPSVWRKGSQNSEKMLKDMKIMLYEGWKQ